MDWMAFTASLVKSLAWPTAVLIVAVVFKSELSSLLRRLRSGKVLGTEWTFGDELSKVETVRATADVVAGRPAKSLGLRNTGDIDQTLIKLAVETADDNPSYAVLAAWEKVLVEIDSMLRKGERLLDLPTLKGAPRKLPAARLIGMLEQATIVPPGFRETFERMLDLRNRVAHGQANPTPGEAVAYIESADWLGAQARRLERDMPEPPAL